MESHRVVPKGADRPSKLQRSENYDKCKLAISDGNPVRKDWAAVAVLVIRQVETLCSHKSLLELDPSWQPGSETEPSTPEKGLAKPRRDVRAPTKQDSLQWVPGACPSFTHTLM